MKIKVRKQIPTESDVLVVTVNGERYEIEKDKFVKVDKKAYEALRNSNVEFEVEKKKKSDK